MPIYQVLYAEDVPHYGTADIEAETDEAAITAARDFDFSDTAIDPEHSYTGLKRIIHIQSHDGRIIAEDIALDDMHVRYGGEADRLLCDAARDMLQTLRFIAGHARLAASNYGADETESIFNRNSSFANIVRRAERAIARAERRGS